MSYLLLTFRLFAGVLLLPLDLEQVHIGIILILVDRVLAVEPQWIPSASGVVRGDLLNGLYGPLCNERYDDPAESMHLDVLRVRAAGMCYKPRFRAPTLGAYGYLPPPASLAFNLIV